jgi:uncharacterized membrane protein
LHLPDRSRLRGQRGATDATPAARLRSVRAVAGFAAVLVGLWLASVEINRYFDARAAAAGTSAESADFLRSKQVAISVVWSLYALGCVAAGFAVRAAGLRYFGLALFALTVGKVMLVDLQSLETGYRILSCLGIGLVLLGTSVLYGKLSPLLLREPEPPAPDDAARVDGGPESASMSDSR